MSPDDGSEPPEPAFPSPAPALGAALLGALLFFPTGGAAQEAVPIDITVGAAREVLSGDRDAWEEYWVRATYRPGPGTHLYGGVRWTRRFGEDDQQFEAGGGAPLAPRWRLDGGATVSPTGRVLPDWGASATVTHRITPEWSLFAGGGRREWEVTGVSGAHGGVERHFQRFRVGYRADAHWIDSGGSGVRHGVYGTFSYGGGFVRLGLGTGRSAAVVGVQDVRSVEERSALLSGIHWLDANTGVSYAFGVHENRGFFTRSTSSIGIRRRF